jgi:hypothetical protein
MKHSMVAVSGAIIMASIIAVGLALKTGKPRPEPIAAAVSEKGPRIIPLYHKVVERAPMDEPIAAVTTMEKAPRQEPVRLAEAASETIPLPRERIIEGNPLATDICTRHGMRKVYRDNGRSWRCHR